MSAQDEAESLIALHRCVRFQTSECWDAATLGRAIHRLENANGDAQRRYTKKPSDDPNRIVSDWSPISLLTSLLRLLSILFSNLFLPFIPLKINSDHHGSSDRQTHSSLLTSQHEVCTRGVVAYRSCGYSDICDYLTGMPRRPSPHHGQVQESGPDARHRYDESRTVTTYDSLHGPRLLQQAGIHLL